MRKCSERRSYAVVRIRCALHRSRRGRVRTAAVGPAPPPPSGHLTANMLEPPLEYSGCAESVYLWLSHTSLLKCEALPIKNLYPQCSRFVVFSRGQRYICTPYRALSCLVSEPAFDASNDPPIKELLARVGRTVRQADRGESSRRHRVGDV